MLFLDSKKQILYLNNRKVVLTFLTIDCILNNHQIEYSMDLNQENKNLFYCVAMDFVYKLLKTMSS